MVARKNVRVLGGKGFRDLRVFIFFTVGRLRGSLLVCYLTLATGSHNKAVFHHTGGWSGCGLCLVELLWNL